MKREHKIMWANAPKNIRKWGIRKSILKCTVHDNI